MKKASYIYGIAVGFSMIGMWVMMLTTGQVPELLTEPVRIAAHIASELFTAFILVIGGILSLRRIRVGERVHIFSLGMLFYSVLNAAGYFMELGDYAMTIMFLCLTIITILFFAVSVIKDKEAALKY